jgi:hypothetical protein
MSVRVARTGAPESPPVTTAGVVGASDEVRTFTKYARPVFVCNSHATEALFVKVNAINASNTDFHFKILAGVSLDVSAEGLLNVDFVSLFYVATAAYTDVKVSGWLP